MHHAGQLGRHIPRETYDDDIIEGFRFFCPRLQTKKCIQKSKKNVSSAVAPSLFEFLELGLLAINQRM